jgi:hypothetical protein
MIPLTVIEGDGDMSKQIAALSRLAVFCLAVGLIGSSSLATAQQKTAKARLQDQPAAKSARPAPPAAGSGDAPVHSTVQDIMQSIIDPSADVLWGASGAVVDKEGIHELAPKTQEEWLEPRRAAIRIIEGGNLLMMPGREAAAVGTKSEAPGTELEPAEITVLIKKKRKSFDAFAKALQGVGTEALRAIESKDADLLLEVGARMENVCEGCHQTFWYPPPEKDESPNTRNNRPNRNR